MLKKIWIFMCIITACHSAIASTTACNEPADGSMSTTKKVVIIGVVGVAAVAAALIIGPLVLPASTVAAIKAAAAAAAAKATAAGVAVKSAATAAIPAVNATAPYVTGAKASLLLGGLIKEQVSPNTEQKLAKLLKEELVEKPFEEQLREAFEKQQNTEGTTAGFKTV